MSDNEDIIEEKVYTVPLRRAWIAPIKKRTPRAIRILREFIKKNMKTDEVIITSEVNERLWSRGIEGSPRKIRVQALKDKNNVVRVRLVTGE